MVLCADERILAKEVKGAFPNPVARLCSDMGLRFIHRGGGFLATPGFVVLSLLCAFHVYPGSEISAQENKPLMVQRAAVLLDEGNGKEAIAVLREYIRNQPQDIRALLLLGDAYVETSQPEKAAEVLRRATSLAPRSADAHLDLGVVEVSLGNRESGKTEFQAALAIEPTQREALYNLGKVFFQEGDSSRAVGFLTKFVALSPMAADGHYLLGQCYARELDPKRAYLEYVEAIKLDPDQETYYISLASLLLSEHGTGGAEEVLAKALSRFPKSVTIWVAAGLVELEAGNLDDAMKDYDEAITLAPESSTAWQLLGKIQAAQGELQKAISTFQRAAQLDPADAQPDFLAGIAYMNLENGSDMALKSFLHALHLNPDFPDTYYWIGTLYLRRKQQYNLASQYFEGALRRAPAWGAAHQLLIQCYRLLGSNAKAEEQVLKYRNSMRSLQPVSDLKAFLEKQ